MSCCGQQRASLRGSATRRTSRTAMGARRDTISYSVAFLRYLGGGALSVRGPVTGQPYHFGRPGAVLPVDPRDLRGLLRLPRVRQVARP
jgi:hypothetical protein